MVECSTAVGDDECRGRSGESEDGGGVAAVVVLCWRMHDKRRGASGTRGESGHVDIASVPQDEGGGGEEAEGNDTVLKGTAMEEGGCTQSEGEEGHVWVSQGEHTQGIIRGEEAQSPRLLRVPLNLQQLQRVPVDTEQLLCYQHDPGGVHVCVCAVERNNRTWK